MPAHLNSQRQPDHSHHGIGDDDGHCQALSQIDLAADLAGQHQGDDGRFDQHLQNGHHFDQVAGDQQAVQTDAKQSHHAQQGVEHG